MIRRALIIVFLMLSSVSMVSATSGLEAQVATVFGINRTINATAQGLAAQRAVTISAPGQFSHAGVPAGYAEVLAWNNDPNNPLAHAVGQWLTSPPHAAILSDARYTQIGCGSHVANGNYYAVCLLPWGAQPTYIGQADSGSTGGTRTNPVPVTTTPTRSGGAQETIPLLPDTSILAGSKDQ